MRSAPPSSPSRSARFRRSSSSARIHRDAHWSSSGRSSRSAFLMFSISVAWLLILGRSGPLNALLNAWFGIEPIDVYSMWGMIVIEGVGFTPLTFLLMSSVLKSTDASFEEASMMSGARPLDDVLESDVAHGSARCAGAGAPGLHPRVRILRSAGARRSRRQHQRADDGHLPGFAFDGDSGLRRIGSLFHLPSVHRGASAARGTIACRKMPTNIRRSPAKVTGRASSISAAGVI